MSGTNYRLPAHLLPKGELSPVEAEEYRNLAHGVVRQTVAQEIELRCGRQGDVDESKWKYASSRNHIKVYKRIQEPHTKDDGQHSSTFLLCGNLACNLEDAIYGVHHKTTEEMRTTTAFCNKRHIDSAVLCTIDHGTDLDPFRYLGIKWRLTESPGGNIIRNRDGCILESQGTGVDTRGERYAYHTVNSLDLPWFPELPDPKIVRARIILSCVYRQREPNVTSMYVKSVFQMGGDLLEFLADYKAEDILLGIPKTVECAETKRLTIQLLKKQHLRRDSRQRLGLSMSRMDRSGSFLSMSEYDLQMDETCGLCGRARKKLVSKIGYVWDQCRICDRTMCSKCYVKKTVFARPKHIVVPVCKPCIMEAKQIPVDPRDPYPMLDL